MIKDITPESLRSGANIIKKCMSKPDHELMMQLKSSADHIERLQASINDEKKKWVEHFETIIYVELNERGDWVGGLSSGDICSVESADTSGINIRHENIPDTLFYIDHGSYTSVPKYTELEKALLEGMKEFDDKLKSGEPIITTRGLNLMKEILKKSEGK